MQRALGALGTQTALLELCPSRGRAVLFTLRDGRVALLQRAATETLASLAECGSGWLVKR